MLSKNQEEENDLKLEETSPNTAISRLHSRLHSKLERIRISNAFYDGQLNHGFNSSDYDDELEHGHEDASEDEEVIGHFDRKIDFNSNHYSKIKPLIETSC